MFVSLFLWHKHSNVYFVSFNWVQIFSKREVDSGKEISIFNFKEKIYTKNKGVWMFIP